MKPYFGLIHLIRSYPAGVDWVLLELMRAHSLVDRPAIIESIFLSAAKACDDKSAQSLWDWFRVAWLDKHLMKYVTDSRGRKISEFDRGWTSESEEISKVEQLCSQTEAEKAMEIWPKLPDWVPCSTGDSNELALPATKKAVLEEIVHRWRHTQDETEADRLFIFLATARALMECGKILEGVIRQYTSIGFPVHRLLRGLQVLQKRIEEAEGVLTNDFRQILLQGVVRNTDPKQLVEVLMAYSEKVVEPPVYFP